MSTDFTKSEMPSEPPVRCIELVRRQRAVKLDKEGLPVRAEDWLLEDWRDLWNGINKIKAKIRTRHRVPPNEKDQP